MFKDILSSAVSIWNAEENRDATAQNMLVSQDFNREEAEKKRAWDERMSNTQYQRMIQDLNASGLSPMLAYSKGTPSLPSGATASGGASGSSAGVEAPKFGEAAARDAQVDLLKEQLEVAKSQAMLNTNSAMKAAAEAENVNVDTENKRLFPQMSEAQIKELTQRSGLHQASASKTTQEEKIDKPRERFATEEPEKAKWLDPINKVMHTVLQGLGLMRGSAAMPFVTQQAPRGKR